MPVIGVKKEFPADAPPMTVKRHINNSRRIVKLLKRQYWTSNNSTETNSYPRGKYMFKLYRICDILAIDAVTTKEIKNEFLSIVHEGEVSNKFSLLVSLIWTRIRTKIPRKITRNELTGSISRISPWEQFRDLVHSMGHKISSYIIHTTAAKYGIERGTREPTKDQKSMVEVGERVMATELKVRCSLVISKLPATEEDRALVHSRTCEVIDRYGAFKVVGNGSINITAACLVYCVAFSESEMCITQREAARAGGISEVTLRNRYCRFLQMFYAHLSIKAFDALELDSKLAKIPHERFFKVFHSWVENAQQKEDAFDLFTTHCIVFLSESSGTSLRDAAKRFARTVAMWKYTVTTRKTVAMIEKYTLHK